MLGPLLKALTLRRLYVLIALAALGTFLIGVADDANWSKLWMPNISAELMGAFITLGVVDFVVRGQRRPLVENAGTRIDQALSSLLQVVLNQRTRTGTKVHETEDAKVELELTRFG